MKKIIIILLSSLVTSAFAEPDIYFLPAEKDASVSFEGITQDGKETHRFEVRRIGFKSKNYKNNEGINIYCCVIYWAGDEYGPSILKQMEAYGSLVSLKGKDEVEIFYSTGANTQMYQRWKLKGSTAVLEEEKVIPWKEDPRTK